MAREKVWQNPDFVRPFHTSTPLRNLELRMKKESRDLVASAGHLWVLSLCNLLKGVPKKIKVFWNISFDCILNRKTSMSKARPSMKQKPFQRCQCLGWRQYAICNLLGNRFWIACSCYLTITVRPQEPRPPRQNFEINFEISQQAQVEI